eukprot:m.127421 g.127421  ORF g.127421 m.127421 type:complete len:169 (+) comp13599_c0_seq8:179-685(+)
MRERKRYCHSATASVRCAPRVPSRSVVILIVLLGIFGIEFRTLLSLDHIPLGHLKRFASVHSNTHTSGPIGVMQTATPTIFNFLLLPSHFSSLACSASPLLPISVHSSMSSTIAKQWTEGPHVCSVLCSVSPSSNLLLSSVENLSTQCGGVQNELLCESGLMLRQCGG